MNIKNIPFVEMKISNWINYLTNMCWNGQGTMIYILQAFKWMHKYEFFGQIVLNKK
jgi:hypothetical protein